MATEVIMPQMGFDMTEGKIVRWRKKEGEEVKRGEIIAEIETEKVVLEAEAFASGTLRRILVHEGETVPVGQVIAILGEPHEDVSAWEPSRPAVGPTPEKPVRQAPFDEAQGRPGRPAAAPIAEKPQAKATEAPGEAEERTTPEGRLRVSPVASRLAQEKGVDLQQVRGTGPGGRIVKEDVLAFIGKKEPAVPGAPKAPAPAPPPRTAEVAATLRQAQGQGVTPLSPMRQAIARRMAQSKKEIPHFYLTMEIDMTRAQQMRESLNEPEGQEARISLNDLAIKAAALALKRFPELNSHYLAEGIKRNDKINIGMAVAMEEGLVAPALLDCDKKTLPEIAKESKDLVERTKAGVLRLEEYAGATFTVTNLGMLGVESFEAIINPPQVAILALGGVKDAPVVREGQVTVGQTMKATISVDHRAVDGAQAAQFMREFKGLLEAPVRLVL